MIKKILVKKKKTKGQIKHQWNSTGVSGKNLKKTAPGKFYKQSVQNIAYFNWGETFSIRKKQTINKIDYYWLKNLRNNKILMKRFQRTELLAVANNFIEWNILVKLIKNLFLKKKNNQSIKKIESKKKYK